MGNWLLGIVAVIYGLVALDYWLKGYPGMTVIWAGYTLANIGFIWHNLVHLPR